MLKNSFFINYNYPLKAYSNQILKERLKKVNLMGLRNLGIKISYDSGEDDVLRNFYIPTLKESVLYKRETGDFSSSALAAAAVGTEGIVKNDGKMLLLANANLMPLDYQELEKGVKDPVKILSEAFVKDLDSIHEKFIENHVKALGWMFANNRLEIKFVISPRGMFHPKVCPKCKSPYWNTPRKSERK